jgi:anaerobic selenocysteine-containing dehydrogenase
LVPFTAFGKCSMNFAPKGLKPRTTLIRSRSQGEKHSTVDQSLDAFCTRPQLFAREFGTNNLPDCSNMCHEASGRALTAALGTGKGTVDLTDWEKTECLIVMGVNAASNAPRMLTSLAEAYRRGAQVVHVNPLIEAASTRTIVPHEIFSMATFHSTRIGTLNIQPRIAGDLALMRGVFKTSARSGANGPYRNRPTLH